MPEFAGEPRGAGRRIVVVASRFNESVTMPLAEAAVESLVRQGVQFDDIDVLWVPGAWELPIAVRRAVTTGRYDAAVAVGAVIRGETPHFDIVAGESARGLMEVSREFDVPVTLGLLTTDTLAQAEARAGGAHGNKGADASMAALELLDLFDRVFPVDEDDSGEVLLVAPDMRNDAFWDGPSQEPLAPRVGRPKSEARTVARTERVETRGRARALQALYAADLRDMSQLRKIAISVFDDLAVEPGEREVASRIVGTVVEHGTRLDAELADITANWRLERLGAIERSVLRLAAAEFARGETPVKVVLQEAVHLAERYGTARSARFVNGVLDAYARRLGRL